MLTPIDAMQESTPIVCLTDPPESLQIIPQPATRMLYSRKEVAVQLSISLRSVDYLISNKALNTRRIGKKVLVPHGELVRFSRQDHPESIN